MKFRARNPNGVSVVKRNATKMTAKMTWPEREFKKLLKELGVKHEVQKIVGKKIFDFYLNEYNLLVEVDGDYWHYNANTIKTENINNIQKRNIKNDIYKNSLATGFGYKIERVWESDLKNNYKEVKKRFKNIIEIYGKKDLQ